MRVLICTYGRSDRQATWGSLPESVRQITQLVVQDKEKHLYPQYPTVVLPPGVEGIGPTRQWIVSHLPHLKIVMLDDDLVFYKRRNDDRTKFETATPVQIEDLFHNLDQHLSRFAMVGVAPREGANRNTESYAFNTRLMRVLGFRMDVLMKEDIRFDKLPVMEDFCATLQLLTKGYDNLLLNNWCHNQFGSNTSGGCSTFRTPEVQRAAAEGLAAMFPEFVTVVKKTTKTAWGGGERSDVRIAWKQARASSLDNRKVESPTS